MTASFGPGPLTPAVKVLLIANVVMFFITLAMPQIAAWLGLEPRAVVESGRLWQPVTYMFLHADVFHILFNMLALWMFGVELERFWGTRFFARYYAITGVGAGLLTVAVSFLGVLLGLGFVARLYGSLIIGASGAIYGLLLAYALYFPNRQIIYIIFPMPARMFVFLLGAISVLMSVTGGGGVAHIAHLSGLLVGYVYLKSGDSTSHPIAELKYRYVKWKINRLRRKFDVYSGGRADDVNRRIH
jgi:membrane associated rhomboid family serine protease